MVVERSHHDMFGNKYPAASDIRKVENGIEYVRPKHGFVINNAPPPPDLVDSLRDKSFNGIVYFTKLPPDDTVLGWGYTSRIKCMCWADTWVVAPEYRTEDYNE